MLVIVPWDVDPVLSCVDSVFEVLMNSNAWNFYFLFGGFTLSAVRYIVETCIRYDSIEPCVETSSNLCQGGEKY